MLDLGFGVTLNPICSTDLEQLRSWRNTTEINKWCRQVGLISDVDQKAWFDSLSKDKTQRLFLIKSPKESPLGVGGLTSICPIRRHAEFSLYIGTEYQGQGYGKKALKSILAFGFDHLNLHQIWGETFGGNPAYKMFVALGMNADGVRRDFYFKNGQYLDAMLVSMLQSEYLGANWRI